MVLSLLLLVFMYFPRDVPEKAPEALCEGAYVSLQEDDRQAAYCLETPTGEALAQVSGVSMPCAEALRAEGALSPGEALTLRKVGEGCSVTRAWMPASQAMLLGIPVDINAASASDLEALPGIGPKTAQAIIEDRETRGPFSSVDDLVRVRGIGPKTLEKIRGLITVGSP